MAAAEQKTDKIRFSCLVAVGEPVVCDAVRNLEKHQRSPLDACSDTGEHTIDLPLARILLASAEGAELNKR